MTFQSNSLRDSWPSGHAVYKVNGSLKTRKGLPLFPPSIPCPRFLIPFHDHVECLLQNFNFNRKALLHGECCISWYAHARCSSIHSSNIHNYSKSALYVLQGPCSTRSWPALPFPCRQLSIFVFSAHLDAVVWETRLMTCPPLLGPRCLSPSWHQERDRE